MRRVVPPIPDYELLRVIGRGSYGEVWLGRGVTGIFRAIKVVWRDRFNEPGPFEREFKGLREFAAISLSAEHHLALLHVGQAADGTFFYYVMELADDVVAGRSIVPEHYTPLTLRELRNRNGRLAVAQCVDHGLALARALGDLHARGLVHRDVKPSNVLVVGGRLKLADIGLVAAVAEARTFVGTEGFVPREGPGAPPADVFGLGKLLYEIATGLDRHEFPRLPTDVSPPGERAALLELNEVLLRACEPDPADRYADGAAMLQDLARLQAGGSLRRRRAVRRTLRWAAVLAVGSGVATWWAWPRPPDPPAGTTARAPARVRSSIAVLPFENLGGDPAQASLAEGLHEELTTQLAKIHDLTVIARTSTVGYKPGTRRLRKIGEDLGVGVLLEGSVTRDGERVRVNVRLVDPRTETPTWSRTYERTTHDTFALQAEMAREIAGALHATLTVAERARLELRPTGNQVAYDLYLRARAIGQQSFIERDPLDAAIGYFEQAIERDPEFALAHAQLALVHSTLYWYGHFDPTEARLTRMKRAAEEALRLGPQLPEARLAMATYYYRGLRDLNRALAEYRAAEAGLPNDAQLKTFMAFIERRLGHWNEALRLLEQAAILNPQDRASASEYLLTLVLLRRYAQAVEFAERYTVHFPDNRSIIRNASRARYELDGDRAAYLARFALMPLQAIDKYGLDAASDLAILKGDYAEADRLLSDPRITYILSPGSVVRDPVAVHRAMLAWLRRNLDAARTFADAAVLHYETQKWTTHQRASVLVMTGQAHAFAGREEQAIRCVTEARESLRGTDAFLEIDELPRIGQVFVILGRADEALAVLREIAAKPSRMVMQEIRHDPIWSKLKADPRFEASLRAAKQF